MRIGSIAVGPVLSFAALGCAGHRTQVEIKPPPPKATTGALAGGLCENGICKCRSGAEDGGAGLPTDNRKRFEVKMTSAYDLWVTLPDRVLYKSPEKVDACFYVDLPPGKHQIQLRASNPNGVSFALEVHELGAKTKDWYDTFAFSCGHPGVCSFADLDNKKAEYTGVERNIHDKCGSTKVKNIVWDHGKSPDQMHPSELVVQAQIEVYKFAPWKRHGANL
jgi:hypothetical protein